MIGKYQFNNQETQKEISAVIEKDTTLNADVTQLQNSECDCNYNSNLKWSFPLICGILLILFVVFVLPYFLFNGPFSFYLSFFIVGIAQSLGCSWSYVPVP